MERFRVSCRIFLLFYCLWMYIETDEGNSYNTGPVFYVEYDNEDQNEGTTYLEDDGFLVTPPKNKSYYINTDECSIPYFYPLDPSAMQYMGLNEKPCGRHDDLLPMDIVQLQYDLGHQMYRLHIRSPMEYPVFTIGEPREKPVTTNFTCCYKEIKRKKNIDSKYR